MSAKATPAETKTDDNQPAAIVETLSELEPGDEFEVYAGEFIVDSVMEDSPVRPILYVRKKSVSGYMDRKYRLEAADPVDTTDETLTIRTKYKSHWDEWSRFSPDEITTEGV